MSDNTTDTTAADTDRPTLKTGVFHTVPRPGGLEAVYTRDKDGKVTRTVRKAKAKG